MSPESKDPKSESVEPGPSSGTAARQSGRAPAAWGAVRDAVAAVHNLTALLRGASVKYKVILDLVPELRTSAGALREAFDRAAAVTDEVTAGVGAFGAGRARDLDALLDATALGDEERDDLAARARQLAGEIEASADLLALLERASEPVRASVSLRLIARELAKLRRGGRGTQITVRLDDAPVDVCIDADPSVVGSLLLLVISLVTGSETTEVVLRASGTADAAVVTVEPAGPADAARGSITVHTLPTVAPTEATARRVTELMGATLELSAGRAVLRVPRAGG